MVKVFQQTVYSFKSFHTAILSYRDLASGYAMMCRMPYTLFTVVLNAMFLLLMPLGDGSRRRSGRRLGSAGRSGILQFSSRPSLPL